MFYKIVLVSESCTKSFCRQRAGGGSVLDRFKCEPKENDILMYNWSEGMTQLCEFKNNYPDNRDKFKLVEFKR